MNDTTSHEERRGRASAGDPATSADMLMTLMRSPDAETRRLAASNRSCPATAIGRVVAAGTDIAACCGAAVNLATAEHLLRRLSAIMHPSVCEATATNPNTPADALERMAGYPDADLLGFIRTRSAVAAHPSTPPATLETLAADPSHTVQRALAHNPVCPPSALSVLAESEHAWVRVAAVAHPNCDPGTLEGYVIVGLTVRNEWTETLKAIARNPSTAPWDLLLLASSTDPDIRSAVATNPKLDVTKLSEMAHHDPHGPTRQAAENTLADTLSTSLG